MQRGKELEKEVFNPEHIAAVLAEIETNFPSYFAGFSEQPLQPVFREAIANYEKEQPKYREYMDLDSLDGFEGNPNSFKHETKTRCPIIRRILMSNDEAMKQYKISFNQITGRQLLNGVKKIAQFGFDYVADFDEEKHEQVQFYTELSLDALNQSEYGCPGVVGYGVQSSLLYGQYPHAFAHRSQSAVWTLLFITQRKDFGLQDASEFMMVQPRYGTCEQNYFYPADLFGFYALKLNLLLKRACADIGIHLENRYRYIYLSAFTDYVAWVVHPLDIDAYTRSSDDWH